MRRAPPAARARAPRNARRARRSSRNMSKLAHAGDSSTASPGSRERDRARTAASSVPHASRRAPRVPASARAIAGASRPISTTARQCASTAGFERREVLALAVAAGDQHDRPLDAVERGQRRGDGRALRIVDEQRRRPSRRRLHPVRQALERARAPRARARSMLRDRRQRAPARRARSARCAGRRARSARRAAAVSPPRASHGSPSRATRPHSLLRRGTPAPNVCTVRPGRRIAHERGSSRFRICTPRAGEDARLRGRVVGDAGVAVEVVRR